MEGNGIAWESELLVPDETYFPVCCYCCCCMLSHFSFVVPLCGGAPIDAKPTRLLYPWIPGKNTYGLPFPLQPRHESESERNTNRVRLLSDPMDCGTQASVHGICGIYLEWVPRSPPVLFTIDIIPDEALKQLFLKCFYVSSQMKPSSYTESFSLYSVNIIWGIKRRIQELYVWGFDLCLWWLTSRG